MNSTQPIKSAGSNPARMAQGLGGSFRLHGAGRIVVACIYLNGKMEKLEVTPKAREKDLISPESL